MIAGIIRAFGVTFFEAPDFLFLVTLIYIFSRFNIDFCRKWGNKIGHTFKVGLFAGECTNLYINIWGAEKSIFFRKITEFGII